MSDTDNRNWSGLRYSFSQQNLILISCAHWPCLHRDFICWWWQFKVCVFSLFCSRGLWEADCTASRPKLTSWPVVAQGRMEVPAQTGTTSGISKPHVMALFRHAWRTIPRQSRFVCSTLGRTSDLAFKSMWSSSGFTGFTESWLHQKV